MGRSGFSSRPRWATPRKHRTRRRLKFTKTLICAVLAGSLLGGPGENGVTDKSPSPVAPDTFKLDLSGGMPFEAFCAKYNEVTGKRIRKARAPRRPGDPPTLVASSSRAKEALGWRPCREDLHTILESAWRWHREHPRGYGG